jgi:hypothetical protein
MSFVLGFPLLPCAISLSLCVNGSMFCERVFQSAERVKLYQPILYEFVADRLYLKEGDIPHGVPYVQQQWSAGVLPVTFQYFQRTQEGEFGVTQIWHILFPLYGFYYIEK